MMAAGVARIKAHGQATTRTESVGYTLSLRAELNPSRGASVALNRPVP